MYLTSYSRLRLIFTALIKSLAMNLVFRALSAKLKYFHFFTLIINIKYKYCKSSIYHE